MAQGLHLQFENDPRIQLLDETTPSNNTDVYAANNYDAFNNFLTYSGPSAKMVTASDGLLKYNPHNLYLNSNTPADQSITVVNNKPYKMVVTGNVSITLSGATTGTVDSINPITFTATTTTLTCGSTTGTGTVHLFNYPAIETYIETAGSDKYGLPITYTNGTANGLLMENVATNFVPQSQNLSSWAQVGSPTLAANNTGPDGIANSAYHVEDANTGGFPYIWWNITSGLTSGSKTTASIYVKKDDIPRATRFSLLRLVRSGQYDCAFDTSTGEFSTSLGSNSPLDAGVIDEGDWWRVYVTAANTTTSAQIHFFPSPGASDFSGYVASATGSAVAWGGQVEEVTAAFGYTKPTSLIQTYGSTATRNRDIISAPWGTFPANLEQGAVYCKFKQVADCEQFIYCLDNATRDMDALRSGGGDIILRFNNPTVGVVVEDPATENIHRVSQSFNSNTKYVGVNGNLQYSNTTDGFDMSNFDIDFASRNGASGTPNLLIKEFLYVPTFLEPYEVDAITGAPEPAINGTPSIFGTSSVGETLFANAAGFASGNGGIYWQWYRDGSAISGANTNIYTLTANDSGANIHVKQVAFNGVGTDEANSAIVEVYSTTAEALVQSWSTNNEGMALCFDNDQSFYNRDSIKYDTNTSIVIANDYIESTDIPQLLLANTTYGPVNYLKFVEQKNGYIQLPPHNLLRYSDWDSELPTGWTAPANTGTRTFTTFNGYPAIQFTANNERPYIQRLFTDMFEPYTSYKVALYGENLGTGNPEMFAVLNLAGVGGSTSIRADDIVDGVAFTVFHTGADNVGEFRVGLGVNSGTTGDVVISGVRLYKWGAPDVYLPTTSSRRFYLPIEYSNGVAQGLRIEPEATCVVQYSHRFDLWLNSATTDARDAVGPDGIANSAYTLTAQAGAGIHAISSLAISSLNPSTNYNLSCYVKPGTASHFGLLLYDTSGGNGVVVTYDISDQTFGAEEILGSPTVANSVNKLIEDAGNGWYRCSATITSEPGTPGYSLYMYILDTNFNRAYTADGTENLQIYGAQLEIGNKPTSLTPTNLVASSRNPDEYYIDGADFPSRANTESLFVKFKSYANTANQTVLSIPDQVPNNTVTVSLPVDTISQVTTAGNTSLGISDSWEVGSSSKIAVAIANNDTAIAGNGGIVTSTANTEPVDEGMRINIGNDISGNNENFDGVIQQIAYYPERLIDYKLQLLSEPTREAPVIEGAPEIE